MIVRGRQTLRDLLSSLTRNDSEEDVRYKTLSPKPFTETSSQPTLDKSTYFQIGVDWFNRETDRGKMSPPLTPNFFHLVNPPFYRVFTLTMSLSYSTSVLVFRCYRYSEDFPSHCLLFY